MKSILIIFAVFSITFLFAHPITVDGDPSDWVGSPPPVDSLAYSSGEAIWTDALNDDVGDGGDAPNAMDDPGPYTYPDTSLFLGTEADMAEWRMTIDTSAHMVYFLVKINNFDVIWTPWVGIAVDLDHEYGAGQIWLPEMADLKVDSLNAWEYVLKLTSNGIIVQDQNWNDVTGSSVVVFDTATNTIEVGWDISALSPNPLDFGIWYLTVYSGLEEFGACREVDSTSSLWHAGGGIAGEPDPDIYDLCFVPSSDQPNDLNNYTDTEVAIIRPTTVGIINLSNLAIEEGRRDANPIVALLTPTVTGNYLLLRLNTVRAGYTKIKIVRPSGEVVGILMSGFLKRGNHTYKFNTSNLSNGVYFLVVENQGFKASRKFIVLR